jgi:hypothetical protein
MEWLFDGIGTMLLGLVVGATGGSMVTWRIMLKKQSQVQRAGDHARQVQAGRDIRDVEQ